MTDREWHVLDCGVHEASDGRVACGVCPVIRGRLALEPLATPKWLEAGHELSYAAQRDRWTGKSPEERKALSQPTEAKKAAFQAKATGDTARSRAKRREAA